MRLAALSCSLCALLLVFSCPALQGQEIPAGVYSYRETVELDDRPWYQPLSFSLRDFLGSEEKSMSFWTIRADTVEATTLKVEKMGEEEIMVNQQSMLAQQVELRAEGLYSPFWHGNYWYRKSDKLFLMYRSVQGLPGTAETVVELMAEPGL